MANDGAQGVYSGHTLVNPLIGFIVFGMNHGGYEERAISQDLPALIRRQVEKRAIFPPLDLGRGLAVDRAVE